jgi:predicted Rossmann fold nucleotide-binding protein DprA/Smf involved in DNA uptake
MNKCPRCYLPQNGIYECQYCGYDLNKYNKKHSTIIRKKLKNIIGVSKKVKVVSTDKKSKVHSMNNASNSLKRKIFVKNDPDLIGGSINIQLIFPKEDRAWTAENDLIAEAQ